MIRTSGEPIHAVAGNVATAAARLARSLLKRPTIERRRVLAIASQAGGVKREEKRARDRRQARLIWRCLGANNVTGDPMLEERKSALLLLINLALLVTLLVATYYGALAVLWQVDVLKLSFVLILLYFATAFAITFNLIGEDLADAIEARLPMIALCGTVYGILSVFQVLAGAKLGSASDFKNLVGPLLAGGGTAMWPTFLALLGSNLLWAQMLIRRAGA
jgi:hypothetical protein